MAATKYNEAPVVEAIAAKLIAEHHPHLQGVPIRYVFRDKASTTAGKIQLGRARLLSGVSAFLGCDEEERQELLQAQGREAFFVIEIPFNLWKDMDDATKRALVDHQLCHCYAWEEEDKEAGAVRKLAIVPHDLEEFACVIARHGLWQKDVEALVKAAAKHVQPEFAFEDSPSRPMAQAARQEERSETVREAPEPKRGRGRPKKKPLEVVEGGAVERKVEIRGKTHRATVEADGEQVKLTVAAIDGEGQVIKFAIDGTRFINSEAAWEHFDSWVENECAGGEAA